MVALLGPQDEFLRLLEREFSDVEFLVRGNEVTLDGPDEEISKVGTLIGEMLSLLRTGQALISESEIGRAHV